jgi:2-methylcitrate dehydratase PrpD
MGVFGAAAAVGHLIGLDEERLSVALAIAASFASGVKANFGTMVKPLHVGQSARNGLLAALLAEAGYDANPAVLEHKQGSSTPSTAPATMTPTRSSTTGPTRSRSPARPWASSSFPAAAAPTQLLP